MSRSTLQRAALVLLFGASTFPSFGAQKPSPRPTGVFSTMHFIPEAGDVLGIEVHVLLGGPGFWVVFQSAEGGPSEPFLVPAKIDGNKIEFTLPEACDYRGTFQGKITKTSLVGRFVGSSETIRLPRRKGYWQ